MVMYQVLIIFIASLQFESCAGGVSETVARNRNLSLNHSQLNSDKRYFQHDIREVLLLDGDKIIFRGIGEDGMKDTKKRFAFKTNGVKMESMQWDPGKQSMDVVEVQSMQHCLLYTSPSPRD